jgi:hypothetical protein
MIEQLEIAYFAGFFDGEGSIGIYRKKYVVCVAQCDPRPLHRMKEIWGGNVYQQTRMIKTHRPKYLWQINGEAGRQFLIDTLPFLRGKKEQAEIYLSVLGIVPLGRGTAKQREGAAVVEIAARRIKEMKREVF